MSEKVRMPKARSEMKAAVYELSPKLHWNKVRTYENVDEELFKRLEAYAECFLGQVIVEYS